LGSGSFKQALGTDSRAEAVRRLPAAMQAFHNAVEAAKGRQLEAEPRRLGEGEITLLVAQWYRAAEAGFATNPRPRQLDPQEREERRKFIEAEAEALKGKRAQLAEGSYERLYPIVNGLLERAGLNVDRQDPTFGVLCQTLGRAWVALEEGALAQMRGEFGHASADPILRDLAATPLTSPGKTARTLEDLIAAYSADKEGKWSQSTANAYRPVFRVLRDVLGPNRDLDSIDREAARQVFDTVKGLPRNLGKHADLAGLPVPAAVAAAAGLGLPTIAAKSINDSYMALMVAMFSWAQAEGWRQTNPFAKLRVEDAAPADEKRDAFTGEQLATIFGGAPWSTGDTAPGGKPSLYWGPLIGLYHGLRIGEPSGMLTDEITEREGVPVFRVKANHLRPLKNQQTRRYLPVHPELIRLGFLTYVEERRKVRDEQLFPEAKRDANGHYGDHVTDWFARLISARGLKGQGVVGGNLTLHSLRHTFEDALRRAGLWGTLEAAVLAGRKRGSDETAAAYGNGHGMARLLDCLSKVTYGEVSVSPAPAAEKGQEAPGDSVGRVG
jgi:integrase